ncbi:DegT/DnrJ/EryC1/StrS family aminotransferase [Pseudobacteriovorax antillogorgiicola]|uniref:UDP-2-acetamido-2-deoxy-ribo-hexuluronate aminotransferase n=1 Tax=Pseudobacteriovorax antillogorgiicola TaxID=1513793 RepID=A0A1Y6CU88_9BACT|nr:DegT/DnrJ/EryC1/StrS aminotransferase family protein [Pseudobacteriovorax antillogorgiicola]TCS45229.1 UDP-2-acetamido-2-deoxy-ribo-hexuluronate aminotransferase [Pseudobacteriovorax antillogorgiicola]SMF75364.1 UDP-2-acetamido-2-deoxy-ribo-hexuluronate aminotransferase [Pseudobacteriovorax antillogorgiicola]
MEFIDLSLQQQKIRDSIQGAINDVLNHGKYIMGPEVQELEFKLAEFTGAQHCVSCGNGTDALLLALMALGIGPGDEVITSTFSFISTSEVIALLGATAVFVDIDLRTYQIDHKAIEGAISNRTKAIIPVSLYGLCSNFQAINKIAAKYKIVVIEDAAQSFGATYFNRWSCNLSHIATTSFFPSKPLGCYGDGGAIFTSDNEIAEKIKILRTHGQSKRYFQREIGINSRLDSIQAAILLKKLDIFKEEIELRQEVANRYNSYLEGIVGIPHTPFGQTHVFGQYTIAAERRDLLLSHLKEHGIPSMVYYPILLHNQVAMEPFMKTSGELKNAEQAIISVLSLPMSPYLRTKDQNLICETVRNFYL